MNPTKVCGTLIGPGKICEELIWEWEPRCPFHEQVRISWWKNYHLLNESHLHPRRLELENIMKKLNSKVVLSQGSAEEYEKFTTAQNNLTDLIEGEYGRNATLEHKRRVIYEKIFNFPRNASHDNWVRGFWEVTREVWRIGDLEPKSGTGLQQAQRERENLRAKLDERLKNL